MNRTNESPPNNGLRYAASPSEAGPASSAKDNRSTRTEQTQGAAAARIERQDLARDEPQVMRPSGELGVTELRGLAQHCFRCAQEDRVLLVLDLSEVDHVDYRGVGMLVAARQLLRRQGGELLLAGASPYVCAILRAAGSHGKLERCATVEAARARLHELDAR